MSKTKIIFTCTAILLASAVLAWGTGFRGIGVKSLKSNTINPSDLQLGVDTKSLPEHRFHDRSFIFSAD
jgi:hypothetical protein